MDVACEEKDRTLEITYLGNSVPATLPRQFRGIFLLWTMTLTLYGVYYS